MAKKKSKSGKSKTSHTDIAHDLLRAAVEKRAEASKKLMEAIASIQANTPESKVIVNAVTSSAKRVSSMLQSESKSLAKTIAKQSAKAASRIAKKAKSRLKR